MTDYERLRQLAENATPGPWAWDQNRVPTLHGQAGDPELYVYETEVIEAEHSGECGCRSACELELNVSDADAEFIAACDPDTVRNLLEDLRLTREDLLAEKRKNMALRRGQGGAPQTGSTI